MAETTRGDVYDIFISAYPHEVTKEVFDVFNDEARFTIEERCVLKIMGLPVKVDMNEFKVSWDEFLDIAQNILFKLYLYDSFMRESILHDELVASFSFNFVICECLTFLVNSCAHYDAFYPEITVKMNEVNTDRDRQKAIYFPPQSMSPLVRARIDRILSGEVSVFDHPEGNLVRMMKINMSEGLFQYGRVRNAYIAILNYFSSRAETEVHGFFAHPADRDRLPLASESCQRVLRIAQVEGNTLDGSGPSEWLREKDIGIQVDINRTFNTEIITKTAAAVMGDNATTKEDGAYLFELIEQSFRHTAASELLLIDRQLGLEIRVPIERSAQRAVYTILFENIMPARGDMGLLSLRLQNIQRVMPMSLTQEVDIDIIELEHAGAFDFSRLPGISFLDLCIISAAYYAESQEKLRVMVRYDVQGKPEDVLKSLELIVAQAGKVAVVPGRTAALAPGNIGENNIKAVVSDLLIPVLRRSDLIEYIGLQLGRNIAVVQSQFQAIAPYLQFIGDPPEDMIHYRHVVTNLPGKYLITNSFIWFVVHLIIPHLKSKERRGDLRRIRTQINRINHPQKQLLKQEFERFAQTVGVNL